MAVSKVSKFCTQEPLHIIELYRTKMVLHICYTEENGARRADRRIKAKLRHRGQGPSSNRADHIPGGEGSFLDVELVLFSDIKRRHNLLLRSWIQNARRRPLLGRCVSRCAILCMRSRQTGRCVSRAPVIMVPPLPGHCSAAVEGRPKRINVSVSCSDAFEGGTKRNNILEFSH